MLDREQYEEEVAEILGEEAEEEAVDFEPLALKLGEALKSHTTLEQINRVASAVFDFKDSVHSHPSIASIHAQTIYDWIMTLGEQPTSKRKKLKLLREFIGTLAPKDSPFKELAVEDEGEEPKEKRIDFKQMALKLGEALKSHTTLNLINKVGAMVFDFSSSLHSHPSIANIHVQAVYDWIMTLSEQPMSEENKIKLLNLFVSTLAPAGSPLKKLAGGSDKKG